MNLVYYGDEPQKQKSHLGGTPGMRGELTKKYVRFSSFLEKINNNNI